jgi:hypothetical protein
MLASPGSVAAAVSAGGAASFFHLPNRHPWHLGERAGLGAIIHVSRTCIRLWYQCAAAWCARPL